MAKKKIHMIGNAHIDPVWLWSWQEGFAEIKATFRSALDRMEEFPEFIFTCACAAYYKWVEENEPGMFEEIRKRVAEGRWVLAGGWWIQPDCNIPSGEAFARHALYSQQYFLKRFGKTAKVGYNVDSFGHNAMLPQILKKSGMDSYVMMRPGRHEKELPASLFSWESPDGTRVSTFRIPINYASWWGEPDPLFEKTSAVLELAESEGTDFMNFYGVGNHGGGPTVKNIHTILKMQEDYREAEILFSSPEAYFQEAALQKNALPVVAEELQHHGSGCYSAHSETKANNRRAEHRVINAEKFAAVACKLTGMKYPFEKTASSWEKLLFNQFHDIMGGCSIKEVYRDVAEFYGKSLTESAEVLNGALQKISWSIDTMGEHEFKLSRDKDWVFWEMKDLGAPIVVFNPLSWPVRQPVQLNREVKGITDDSGSPRPFQKVRAGRLQAADKWDTLFVADIPAMGYNTYWAYSDKEIRAETQAGLASHAAGMIENRFFRLSVHDGTGQISSLFDKRNCREVFSGAGAAALVIDEEGVDTWGHDRHSHSISVLKYDKVAGYFGDAVLSIIETGPVRTCLRVKSKYGSSTLRQDFILYADKEEVEVKVKLDWREEHKMLKLCFPVNVTDRKAVYDIPFGFIKRPADGKEEPGQQWFDLSGRATGSGGEIHGLAVLNDGKYSFCTIENEMRLTVVRSPIYAEYESVRDDLCEFMDQGIQEFNYTLVPHQGGFIEAGVVRKAYELNVPAVRITETYHKGTLPRRFEGISISSPHVVAAAFKRAESEQGYILRCCETSGREFHTGISLPFLNRKWEQDFGPFEVITFFVPDDNKEEVIPVNFLEA